MELRTRQFSYIEVVCLVMRINDKLFGSTLTCLQYTGLVMLYQGQGECFVTKIHENINLGGISTACQHLSTYTNTHTHTINTNWRLKLDSLTLVPNYSLYLILMIIEVEFERESMLMATRYDRHGWTIYTPVPHRRLRTSCNDLCARQIPLRKGGKLISCQ